MRPFYLLAAAAIVAVAWLVYTKFFSQDGAETAPPTVAAEQTAASSTPPSRKLTAEQIRNRKEIIKTYERQLREAANAQDKKRLQEKISAIQKEIAGS